MATTTTPGTPRWADRRTDRSARYARKVGASKTAAKALGYSQRRRQQINQGDHTSTEARTLEHLDRLMENPRLDEWAFVGMQHAHIHGRRIEPLPDEELRERWLCACTRAASIEGRVAEVRMLMRQECCESVEGRKAELLEDIHEKLGRLGSHFLELAEVAGEKIARSR